MKNAMSKPKTWCKTVVAFSLLLIVCAVAASAQSSRGALTVSLQVVPSTMLIFSEDGKTRIIEANGTNGMTVTTINAPAEVDKAFGADLMRTNASKTPTPQTRQAPGTGTQSK
jgi:hypothetical protein